MYNVNFFRGTSQDNKMVAFRESYGKLFELRSLASEIPVIALTATATHLTRDTIVSILHMEHFVEVKESPNKTNLRYVVHCMDKKAEHEENFVWLADTLRRERQNSVWTIVYCQTIKSECQQKSNKIRNKRQKCENPNLLKLRLLVVHIKLFIDMWFISQIDFCFGRKWRY